MQFFILNQILPSDFTYMVSQKEFFLILLVRNWTEKLHEDLVIYHS